jgi:hypothetical protein
MKYLNEVKSPEQGVIYKAKDFGDIEALDLIARVVFYAKVNGFYIVRFVRK